MRSSRKRNNDAVSSGQNPSNPSGAAIEAKRRGWEINLLAISTIFSMMSAIASSIAACQSVEQIRASREIAEETSANQGFTTLVSSVHTLCQRVDAAPGLLDIRLENLGNDEGEPVVYSYRMADQVNWGDEGSLKAFSRSIFPLYENALANTHSMRYYISENQYKSLGSSIDPLFNAVLALRNEVNSFTIPRGVEQAAELLINLDYKCRRVRSLLPDWYVERNSNLKAIAWPEILAYPRQDEGSAAVP